MKTFETYCPVFHGFYGSIWDCDSDIDNYLDEEDLTYDEIEFDNATYQKDISQAVCDFLESELSEFVTALTFQELISPKYYNFSNDSINVEIELSEYNTKQIQGFIYQNRALFKEYLKERYTSRSGFIPSHSNEFEVWSMQTNDFTDFEDNKHWLGTILDFICEVNEIDQEALYYGVHDNGDLNGMFYCSPLEIED